MRINNHIRSAVGKLSQHKQLSHDSLTTNDFGQIVPVLALPLLPRDKMSIRTSCFSRVAPMIFPTYGNCEVVTNFHSVQYSQIWRDFDIFVTGQKTRGVQTLVFPTIASNVLNQLYLDSDFSTFVNVDASNADFVVLDSKNITKYYRLTILGRYVRKIFNSLGYPFPSFIDLNYSVVHYFSALPLLSLFKVYYDFYQSRQYSVNSNLAEILRCVYVSDVSTSFYSKGSSFGYGFYGNLTFNALRTFISSYKLLYPSDYFTSAQTFPSLVGGSSPLTLYSNTSGSSGFYQASSLIQSQNHVQFQSVVNGSSVGSLNVSQSNPMHRLLDNFENLIRRYNLVGSREVDRIRSSFGIRPSVQRNQYSTFHGGFSSDLRIQDVTSTSSDPSSDVYLGSYAGKGIVSDCSSFNIESDDFGYLIALSFVRVRPLYSPGLDREVLKISPTAYYNPDFDHGYAMALSVGEVQAHISDNASVGDLLSTFGYQNAYDEYRQRVSRVNGDFVDTDLLSWSFVRDNVGDGYTVAAQSDNLIYQTPPQSPSDVADPDKYYNEFQRIFVDGSGRDHFYLYYGFIISALRPVRSSSESFDLGVGNVSTSNNPVV